MLYLYFLDKPLVTIFFPMNYCSKNFSNSPAINPKIIIVEQTTERPKNVNQTKNSYQTDVEINRNSMDQSLVTNSSNNSPNQRRSINDEQDMIALTFIGTGLVHILAVARCISKSFDQDANLTDNCFDSVMDNFKRTAKMLISLFKWKVETEIQNKPLIIIQLVVHTLNNNNNHNYYKIFIITL